MKLANSYKVWYTGRSIEEVFAPSPGSSPDMAGQAFTNRAAAPALLKPTRGAVSQTEAARRSGVYYVHALLCSKIRVLTRKGVSGWFWTLEGDGMETGARCPALEHV